MKERKTNRVTGQRQYLIAGCLTLILVTCLSGLYVGRNMEQQNKEAQLAKETEKTNEDAADELLQAVDSVVLPDRVEEEAPVIEPKEEDAKLPEENNDMDVAETDIVEEASAAPVGGAAVQVKSEAVQPVFGGELQWPVEGSVLMNYSMDSSVYFATLDQYKYNPAMIIQAASGDAVAAAAAGTVKEIRQDAQTGLTVVMDIGDGYELTYGQLQELNYKEGAQLDAGDVIGTVAQTSKYYSLEGDNLYFGMTKDDAPVDPTEYLPQ